MVGSLGFAVKLQSVRLSILPYQQRAGENNDEEC